VKGIDYNDRFFAPLSNTSASMMPLVPLISKSMAFLIFSL